MSDFEEKSKAAFDALRRERDAREQSEHCSCWQNGHECCACGDDSDGVGEDACCPHGGSQCQQPQAHDRRWTVSVRDDLRELVDITHNDQSLVGETLQVFAPKLVQAADEIDRLNAAVTELAAALNEAADDAEDYAQYAGAHLAQKRGVADDIARYRSIAAKHTPEHEIEDGFGSTWLLCGEDCGLQVVRPGKVQCVRSDCKADQ